MKRYRIQYYTGPCAVYEAADRIAAVLGTSANRGLAGSREDMDREVLAGTAHVYFTVEAEDGMPREAASKVLAAAALWPLAWNDRVLREVREDGSAVRMDGPEVLS